MISRFVVLVVACGSVTAIPAADPAPTATREFKLTIVTEVTMEAVGQTQKAVSDANYRYSWKRAENERTLALSGVSVKDKLGDSETRDLKMSRAGFFGTQAGQPIESKYDDAPDEIKRMLRDSFGSPLYKLEIGANGEISKRTLVAQPGSHGILGTGVIANTTLFHPPYPADKNEWQAEVAVSAAKGEATGKATYTKIEGGKGGQAVRVTGTLSADGVKADDKRTVKGSKYVMTGTQLYDPERKDWVSGKLDIDITFQLVEAEKVILTAKGKMTATFEMLSEKK